MDDREATAIDIVLGALLANPGPDGRLLQDDLVEAAVAFLAGRVHRRLGLGLSAEVATRRGAEWAGGGRPPCDHCHAIQSVAWCESCGADLCLSCWGVDRSHGCPYCPEDGLDLSRYRAIQDVEVNEALL